MMPDRISSQMTTRLTSLSSKCSLHLMPAKRPSSMKGTSVTERSRVPVVIMPRLT